MNKPRALDLIALAALVAVSGATLIVYPHLPDPMPTHFDLHGRVDGWSSRAFGAWFAPAVAAASWALSRATRGRALSVAAAAVSLFLVGLHVLVLRTVLGGTGELGGGLAVLLGVFQIVMGLIFPRLRRNRFVGIRLPWTLASDENWARTHRFGGGVMVASGVAMLAAAALLGAAAIPVALVMLLIALAIVSAYSYRLAHGSS
ncbi:MAG TPA: SdpI family protein [Polyangiaceae bacterium]|nr:SdpI family protein [Polyangiaceae bacterium]